MSSNMTRQSTLQFAHRKNSLTAARPAKRSFEHTTITDDDADKIDLTEVPHFEMPSDLDDSDDDTSEDDEEPEEDLNEEQDEIQILSTGLARVAISDIPAGYSFRNSVTTISGLKVHAGMCLEGLDQDFLRVTRIFQHTSGVTLLEGILFRRAKWVDRMLPKKLNEVCALLEERSDAPNLPVNGAPVFRSLDWAAQVRQLVLTNKPFPAHSYRFDGKQYLTEQAREDDGVLVCRRKFIQHQRDKNGKHVWATLTALSESDCDEGARASDAEMRYLYGSDGKESVEIDLTASIKRQRREGSNARAGQKKWTSGDICSGGGGSAKGAVLTGQITLRFVLDHGVHECETLRLNFASTEVIKMALADFIATRAKDRSLRVDMLHISFPCQPHSAANPGRGRRTERDFDNIVVGYTTLELLTICKPRIVTFEQTSHLLVHHYYDRFTNLVHQIIWAGYNVRWKILKADDYSNVHARKRLIMLASCPGQPLPEFPKATHGSGLKPYVTIQDRLKLLPQPRRIPDYMKKCTRRNMRPYDANQPLKKCITTSGGEGNLHPSGNRSFNLAELALLNGFPASHRFARAPMGAIRRQIGNAVPCMMAKLMFDECVKTLNKTDGIQEQQNQAIALDEDDDVEDVKEIIQLDDEDDSAQQEVIVLDDDEDDDDEYEQQLRRQRRRRGKHDSSIQIIEESDEEDGNSANTAWVIPE